MQRPVLTVRQGVITTSKCTFLANVDVTFVKNVHFEVVLSPVRLSVCRLSVCLSSVTLVHPTQAVVIFGNISTAFGSFAIN